MKDLIERQAAIDDLHGKDPSQIWDTADVEVWLNDLPSAQPEPCDDPRADIYYLAEKIGIHRLYALVVELRGEPEPCEDTISRQQAITALRALSDDDGYINAPHEVVTDVVRGLPPVRAEHEQTTQPEQTKKDKFGVKISETCEDCISRQAAISAICNACGKIDCDKMDKCEKLQLPPANCSEFPNNSDTISRQAAIDALHMHLMYRMGTDSNKKRLDEWINNLPSARPEQRWIPCSERLPETDGEVLITVLDMEEDYVEVYKGFYQDQEWWTQWCHGCLKIKDEPCGENIVTAWMPLPEPYKERQDG